MSRHTLLAHITAQYLGSPDFNGLALHALSKASISQLRRLVRGGKATVVFGDLHPNPHIRALPDETPEAVLEKLDRLGPEWAVAYPTPAHLRTVVSPSEYAGEPYRLALALGGAQLSHRAFDLHVLEPYRNDPRYVYDSDDIRGQLSAKDNSGLRSADEVILRFGFAYGDGGRRRFAAAFLWDLFKLSPEHQQIWAAREVPDETWLHPDYYRTQVIGDWPERMSIYDAFLLELRIVNEMAVAMGREPLFRDDFQRSRPKGFASLLRPTQREFDDFVRLLDGMLSDNIDKSFFGNDVPLTRDETRSNGRVWEVQKGSLQLLREWLDANVRLRDPARLQAMLKTFGDVRKLRNKPSHRFVNDEFSDQIAADQRELVGRAYDALRTLRLILANHPAAKVVEVPKHLFEGRIWMP